MMDSDFSFGFQHTGFSDRLLRVEIMPDILCTKSDGDGCSSTSEWARDRKPWLEQIKKENAVDVLVQHDEQISNCNMPDTEDGIPCQNQDAEAVAVIEESPSGDEPVQGNDSSSSGDGSTVLRVETIPICALLLAAKSPFFKKLFSNGMRDSSKRHVILRIHASEEAALMDVLNFMYTNSLSAATPYALLDVLVAADKFEVVSCMKYCSQLLRSLSMTCESALLYLDLPSTLSMAESVQPLTEEAKQFLAGWFKDINKFPDEVMNLPLDAIEAVLSSDELQVASEDAVYDIMLQWARTHYLRPAERREIIGTRLARLIRFPYMSCGKLKKVLTCNDFDPEIASRVMLEALFFKAEAPYGRRSNAAEEPNALYRGFVERVYKDRPVKVVEFKRPYKQCVVYLDLKREECAHLVPAGRVNSEAFHFGGKEYFLSAQCNMDPMSSRSYFGLFLGMQENGSGYYALVEYVFEARSELTGEYMIVHKGISNFSGGTTDGHRNLFGTTFSAFMANGHYFINGILHLRAELTIRQSSYERD